MSTLRSLNIEKNKQRILNAAQRIIIEKGIDSLSVRGLAAESELALRSIYNLYGNKENVITAILEQGTQGVEKGLFALKEAIEKGSWKTKNFISSIGSLESVFLDNQEIIKPALLASLALGQINSKAASAIHERRIKKTLDLFQLAADKNIIRKDLDLRSFSNLLYHNYFSLAVRWALNEIDDHELRNHSRYNILSVLYTLDNDLSRQEEILELMKAVSSQTSEAD